MFVIKRNLILVSLLASSSLWLTRSNIQADEVPPTGTISDTRSVQQIGQTGQWRLQLNALDTGTDQLTLDFPAGVQLDAKQVLADNQQTVSAIKVVNPNQWQLTLRDVPSAKVMISYQLTSPTTGQLQLWQQNHLLVTHVLPAVQSMSSSSSSGSSSSSSVSSSSADTMTSVSQSSKETSTTKSSTDTSHADQTTSQTAVSHANQASTDSNNNPSQTESSDSSISTSQSKSPSNPISNNSQDSNSNTLPPAAVTSALSAGPNRTHQIVQQQSVGLVGKLPALDFGQVHATDQKQLIAPVNPKDATPVGIVDALPTGKHWQLKIQSSATVVDPAQLVWLQAGQAKSIQTGLTIVTSSEPSQPLLQDGREIARYYPLPWDAKTGLRLLLPATANPPLGKHSVTLTWTIQQVP